MKTFTKAFMLENRGCYEREQVISIFFSGGNDSITAEDILNANIGLKDKYWFFCRKVFSSDQNRQIAIDIAECVLPIYEAKHQNNTAPRKAIEAAKKFLAGEIAADELLQARNAAYAAYAAAAVYADAYADAAAAAYAAAYADAYTKKLTDILKTHIQNIPAS